MISNIDYSLVLVVFKAKSTLKLNSRSCKLRLLGARDKFLYSLALVYLHAIIVLLRIIHIPTVQPPFIPLVLDSQHAD